MYRAPYTVYNCNYDNNVKNPAECIMSTCKNKYGSLAHPTCPLTLTDQGLHIITPHHMKAIVLEHYITIVLSIKVKS